MPATKQESTIAAATNPVTAPIIPDVDVDALRCAILDEYSAVAETPDKGFHFHTGRALTRILKYEEAWLDGLAEDSIASFAGTGSPFSMGVLGHGERVVDVGSGSGMDSLIAGKMVGPAGAVVGVDMTPAMLRKARRGAVTSGLSNVEFRAGYGEALPVADGWADVVISNGVLNLFPDKVGALEEMARVLKPGGRLQIADILVKTAVPNDAKQDIDLWKG